MTKRWECSVCGYIHDGDQPPEKCPVCGADRAKFVPLKIQRNNLFYDLIDTFRLHPVMAHFPNGLIPTAALFVLISLTTSHAGLEAAAFWLVLTATVVVPVSLGSGIHAWHKFFGWNRAPIFFKKLGLALMLLILGVVAIFLRQGQPGLLTTFSWLSALYLLCLVGMLGCVGLLGHYGSLLAVQARARDKTPSAGIVAD